MTIADIETAIKVRLNRDTPVVIDNIREWVNQRQRQILRTKNFGFLWKQATAVTPTSGTRTYGLPKFIFTDTSNPQHNTNSFKDDYAMWFEKDGIRTRLHSAEMQSLNRLYGTTDTGTPIYYFLRANDYDLYPIPDAASTAGKIILEYYEYLADFVARVVAANPDNTGANTDGATNYLTMNYPDLLIAGGAAEAFGVLGQIEEMQLYEARFGILLKECQEDDNEKSFSLVEQFVPDADAYALPEQGRVI